MEEKKMDWKKLIEILKEHKVWIQTHNFPDPDAIASAFGLQYFLKQHGVEASICYNGHVDKISVVKMLSTFGITILPIEQIDIRQKDYVVLVDGQKYNANLTDIPGDEVACIDHHPTFKACDYLYKDVRITGSCATLIAQYFKESQTPIDAEVASALTYGMKVDTDSFNRGVTKLDIEMYEYLFAYADAQRVQSMFNNSMELADLRAYGAAIENIKILEYIGMAHIPFDCEDALIAMVADFILKLDEVTIAVIYAERKGGLKFSVRSEERGIHAGNLTRAALAGRGDGGGHFTMAGGFVPADKREHIAGDEEQYLEQLFVKTVEQIKSKSKG